MSILPALVGSGAAIVTIAVAVILMRHLNRAPSKAHPWLRRLAIILMYAAGSVIAASGAASFLSGMAGTAAAWAGGQWAPLITTGVVIAALVLFTGTAVAFIWAPDDHAAVTALFVPLALGLVSGGVLHELYVATTIPGQQVAAALHAWLAG